MAVDAGIGKIGRNTYMIWCDNV